MIHEPSSGPFSARFSYAERFLVERQRLFQIEHMRAAMDAFSDNGHGVSFR